MSTAARGFLGSGDLYINRIVGGIRQGLQGPFEATRFEIKANAQLRERTSRSKGGYGTVVASAAVPQPFDLNITMGEADRNGLSIALLGTSQAANQASGTQAPTAMEATVLDVWLPLPGGKGRVSDVTVTSDPAGTTHALGDDFLINDELGLIKFLSTGDIALGADLLVGYDYAAIEGLQILGATASAVRAEFWLDGKNLADDTPCIVKVWEGVVASQAAIDFLSDQFLEIPLQGRLVKPADKASPFVVEQRNAAV